MKDKNKPSPESSYFRIAARNFYLLATTAFIICLLLNQPEYFQNSRKILIVTDLISSLLILTVLFLYLKKVINLKLSSSVYVYTTITDLIISCWYFHDQNVFFSNNFLLITFMYCIQIVVAGFCINLKHSFIIAGIYIVALGPLLFISNDIFLNHNAIAIIFLIAAFAAGISGFLYVLEKTHKEDLALKEKIFEKDKSIAYEQYRRICCELESKQKEITTKTMFLVEFAEKNNALFEKLRALKGTMKKQNEKLLDDVMQRYWIENQEKYWKEFETSFMEVNPEFNKKLSVICPEISPAELKLATFLRMGLSSKQIGSLTSNSTASVDVARSRLKSKLKLSSDVNLKSFLLSL